MFELRILVNKSADSGKTKFTEMLLLFEVVLTGKKTLSDGLHALFKSNTYSKLFSSTLFAVPSDELFSLFRSPARILSVRSRLRRRSPFN